MALSCRPLLFLGEISYSIYLVHQLALRFFSSYPQMTEGLPRPVALAIYGLVVLAVSSAIYYAVEVPARRAIRGLPRSVRSPAFKVT
jgi:peptidoglycan/LPS O-acetylase OafA/YrhL